MSARSKRWAGRRLGIQGEGGGRLAAFLLPSPAHPLPQGQAFNPADSVCAVKAGTGPHIPAGGGVGVGLQTSPEVGEGGAVPSTSAPHSGSCWLLPCPHRRGEPSQTWAGLRAPQLPFQPQPGASPVATPPRAPQGLRRPRRGEVWADVAPAEGGSPRVRMEEPGELKPELPLSWGLGRSA